MNHRRTRFERIHYIFIKPPIDVFEDSFGIPSKKAPKNYFFNKGLIVPTFASGFITDPKVQGLHRQ